MYNLSIIILAAGLGKRMRSEKSKVLHEIGGKPMILRTFQNVEKLNPSQIIVVANKDNIKSLKKILGTKISYVIQKSQKGTAHAVQVALLAVSAENVAVLYGDDSAFYGVEIIRSVYQKHTKSKAALTFVTLIQKNPTGLGRVIRKRGKLEGIVEQKDASVDQLKIKEVNDGLYFFRRTWLQNNLKKIKKSDVTGEYYITDLIGLALKNKQKVQIYKLTNADHWHSINTPQELKEANHKLSRKVHIMGIAGAGASAVAAIAKRQDYDVSGCDISPHSAYESNLKGIDVKKGHNADHLHNIGKLVISSAILKSDPENEEVAYAKKHKIPILLWERFQSQFLQRGKFVIAVAGAYGKSTTTAMVSKILIDAGLSPTCEIGAKVLEWGVNYHVGKSKYLGSQSASGGPGLQGTVYVCEVDEYLDKFLNYNPDIAIVLNLGWDHPDYFKSHSQLEKSYKNFIKKVKPSGTLIIPPNLENLAKSAPNSVTVVKIQDFGKYDLSIIGDFRKENADAALTVAKLLGVGPKKAKKSVESFKGTGRRLELKGTVGKTVVYDDYAVQPYTVLKTTNALKAKYPNRPLILIFEPHTFSRINTFFKEFVDSLKKVQAEKIFVTDIYKAREQGDVKSLAKKLARVIGPKTVYSGSIEQTAKSLKNQTKNDQVILSMGAGDVYKIYDLLKK